MRLMTFKTFYPLVVSMAFTLAAISEPVLADTPVRPYVLEGTEVHSVPSKILPREYEIFVSLPDSYATSKQRYPVLFTTDANYAFPVIRSINRRVGAGGKNLQEFILVALSYAKGDSPTLSRNRDYTPTDIDAKKTRERDQDGKVYGQAEQYRRHVAEEVFPYVEKHFRADMSRKVFAGHSYGALFGAHVLLTAPSMFDHYVLSSPSLWFDKRYMFEAERQYAATHKDLPAKVLLLAASYEAVRPNAKNKRYASKGADIVVDMKAFEKQLKSHRYPGLVVRSEVIPEEDHLSAFPSAITRGLLWAFGKA
jgi:uncharacterized protein